MVALALKICEIFGSIQGEGIQTGIPMVFVRFGGCNLKCDWCDTKYADEAFVPIDEKDIVKEIKSQHYKWVCLTGGEPFLQDLESLVTELVREHYYIAVETNGTIVPSHVVYHLVNVMTISPKLTNSGMLNRLKPAAVASLARHRHSQLKFVVGDRADIVEALTFCHELAEDYGLTLLKYTPIVFQPLAFPSDNATSLLEKLKELWQYCQECRQKELWDIRVMPQLHRLVWGPRRGV